jgi:hypothetical protein
MNTTGPAEAQKTSTIRLLRLARRCLETHLVRRYCPHIRRRPRRYPRYYPRHNLRHHSTVALDMAPSLEWASAFSSAKVWVPAPSLEDLATDPAVENEQHPRHLLNPMNQKPSRRPPSNLKHRRTPHRQNYLATECGAPEAVWSEASHCLDRLSRQE